MTAALENDVKNNFVMTNALALEMCNSLSADNNGSRGNYSVTTKKKKAS